MRVYYDRTERGVDDRPPWLIVLVASSNGIRAISSIVGALPKDFPAAVIVLQHRSAAVYDMLFDILKMRALMPVERIGHGQMVLGGRIYISRPDLHLEIDHQRRFRYHDGIRRKGMLSSASPLLASAAEVFGSRMIAVVLTGRGSDAADGVRYVRGHGGFVVALDPATAPFPEMPAAAIETGAVNEVLEIQDIAPVLIRMVTSKAPLAAEMDIAALTP